MTAPILDPFEPEKRAINCDGEIVHPIRYLRVPPGYTPTAAELTAAPIIGWAKKLGWGSAEDDRP